jgi:hypothetical protein
LAPWITKAEGWSEWSATLASVSSSLLGFTILGGRIAAPDLIGPARTARFPDFGVTVALCQPARDPHRSRRQSRGPPAPPIGRASQ